MTSVGCYDFLRDSWEVGPEIFDLDEDPVSELYDKSRKRTDGIIDDVRNIILKAYELAIVIKKSNSPEFKKAKFDELKNVFKESSGVYKKIKKARSSFEKDPVSKADAIKKRNDKNRRIADASFKFLDKFGYIELLKTYV